MEVDNEPPAVSVPRKKLGYRGPPRKKRSGLATKRRSDWKEQGGKQYSKKRIAAAQARQQEKKGADKRGRTDPAQLELELRAANMALRDHRKANAALKEKFQEQKTHLKETQAELKKHQKQPL
jgi:hypothetical protein